METCFVTFVVGAQSERNVYEIFLSRSLQTRYLHLDLRNFVAYISARYKSVRSSVCNEYVFEINWKFVSNILCILWFWIDYFIWCILITFRSVWLVTIVRCRLGY